MFKLNASDNHFSIIRTVCAEIIHRDPMSSDHHLVTCESANMMDVSLEIATELMAPWGFDVVGQPSGRISIRPVVKTRDICSSCRLPYWVCGHQEEAYQAL